MHRYIPSRPGFPGHIDIYPGYEPIKAADRQCCMIYYNILCCFMLRDIMLWYGMLCYAVLWYVTICCVRVSSLLLCYVFLLWYVM